MTSRRRWKRKSSISRLASCSNVTALCRFSSPNGGRGRCEARRTPDGQLVTYGNCCARRWKARPSSRMCSSIIRIKRNWITSGLGWRNETPSGGALEEPLDVRIESKSKVRSRGSSVSSVSLHHNKPRPCAAISKNVRNVGCLVEFPGRTRLCLIGVSQRPSGSR